MDRRRFLAAASLVSALAPRLAHAQADPETSQYMGSVLTLAAMMSWVFAEEARLTAGVSQTELLDEEWRIDFLAPFAVAAAAQEAIAQLDPPLIMQEAHDYFAEAIDLLVLAGEEARVGVLDLDAAALSNAADYINLSGEAITNATAALPTATDIVVNG